MWMANLIFGSLGLLLVSQVESTTDASRGGGIREWWSDRLVRRSLRATMAAERANPAQAGA